LIDARNFTPIFVSMALFPLAGTLLFIILSRPSANGNRA
jgi:hypothetical protein